MRVLSLARLPCSFPCSSSSTHDRRTRKSQHQGRDQQEAAEQMMESHDVSPPHADAFRPSLGFPLGTALLLLVVFTLSGIFSCCYHWEKIRSLRRSYAAETDPEQPPLKSNPEFTVNNPKRLLRSPRFGL